MCEIDSLKQALMRERMARKAAENLLETKSRELWFSTQENKRLTRQRVDREREARKAAEALLETKSREIFDAYTTLQESSTARFKRERQARKEAEGLLESKSRELWEAYQENARLGAEVQITRRLQEMVLPGPSELDAIEMLEIAAYTDPAHEVGGDYFDVLPCANGVKIGIGDVTDHGLESGVIMLMAQTAVRALQNSGEADPVRFLDVLNRTIFDNVQRMQTDRNLTLALLDYQQTSTGGQIRISGQHEEVIVIRQDSQIEIIETDDLGFPIGLDNDIGHLFHSTTIDLRPGDGIVLFTDGVTEAEDRHGEYFGLERLCQAASTHWASPADVIKEAVIEELRSHIGTQVVYDDITLVVLKQR